MISYNKYLKVLHESRVRRLFVKFKAISAKGEKNLIEWNLKLKVIKLFKNILLIIFIVQKWFSNDQMMPILFTGK